MAGRPRAAGRDALPVVWTGMPGGGARRGRAGGPGARCARFHQHGGFHSALRRLPGVLELPL